MMVYKFKDAAHLSSKLDPQLVGERLAAIREAGGGFTPEAVVADARHTSSPLHEAFTWDDSDAAERYRLGQAGYLVRSVVVLMRDDKATEREVRAFVPVTIREVPDDQRYLSVVEAMSDEDYRSQVIGRALGEMLALRRKYQDIAEFGRIFKAIDATAKSLEKVAA